MKRSKMSQCLQKKKRVNWTYREVETMLKIVDEHNIMAKLDGKEFRAEQCYNEVAEELQRLQYDRDAYQVAVKFRSEKQRYRDHVRHQGTSGMDFTTLEHGTLLHKILGDRPSSKMVCSGVDSSRDAANINVNDDSTEAEECYNVEWLDESTANETETCSMVNEEETCYTQNDDTIESDYLNASIADETELQEGDQITESRIQRQLPRICHMKTVQLPLPSLQKKCDQYLSNQYKDSPQYTSKKGKNIVEPEHQSEYSKNKDLYQDQNDDLPGCSEMQSKFTTRPQNVDRRYVPMSQTSPQEQNLALTAQKSITLHRRNLSETEPHDIEPHFGAHYNVIQHHEQREIQRIPANNEYPRADNINVHEGRPQMDQHQRRLPNAVQLRNQDNNQAVAANNPRPRDRNIPDKTKGRKSYDKALATFQDNLSASQSALQTEFFEAHKKFWQDEAAASRQWEEQQLEKQRKHSEELVRLSNQALNSAIDRLLTGMRPPPVASIPYPFHQYASGGSHGFPQLQHYPTPMSASSMSHPMSASMMSPPMSASRTSPPMSASSMSPSMSASSMSSSMSASRMSPPMSGSSMSPSMSASRMSPPMSGSRMSPPMSGSSMSSSNL